MLLSTAARALRLWSGRRLAGRRSSCHVVCSLAAATSYGQVGCVFARGAAATIEMLEFMLSAAPLDVCWHARLQEHGPHFSRPLPAHSARVRQALVGRQRLGWMSAIERWHSKPFASGVFSRVPGLFAPLPRWSTPAVVPAIRHTHRKASRASLREHPLASGCLLRWRSMIA
jgi:hypothetical protein